MFAFTGHHLSGLHQLGPARLAVGFRLAEYALNLKHPLVIHGGVIYDIQLRNHSLQSLLQHLTKLLGTRFAPYYNVLIGFGCAPFYSGIIHSTPQKLGVENSSAVIGVEMALPIGATFTPPL